MKKTTAVEFYAKKAMKLEIDRLKGYITTEEMLNQLSIALKEAKEMEKEQIIEACESTISSVELSTNKKGFFAKTGESYYKENYEL
jgi:predicted nucleic-acid-binding protein